MENIKQALYGATGNNVRHTVKKLGVLFEKETLSYDEFPEACLGLIVEILSVEELFTKPGIEHFLLTIATDMVRLTARQKQKLLMAVCDNYHRYSNLEMCWRLGDMIARSYDQPTAMEAFRKIFSSATDQGKEGVALGLDVIARQSKRDSRVMSEIEAILQ